MRLFRYSIVHIGEDYYDCALECEEFEVVSETPKSYLIKFRYPRTVRGKTITTKRVIK